MDKSAVHIIGYDRCCSCSLCQDSCPFDAISMGLDENGFYKPYVNPDGCTDCGCCARTCPIINIEVSDLKFKEPIIYGGWSRDDGNVASSSSGGLFFELASDFINAGGAVCGVRWEDGILVYDVADTVDGLYQFRGSKYLQADARGIYRKVKALVRQGTKVLFVGLPCQVQAISNFIKSEKLFLVDVVCAGVPSMLMYRKYCEETFPGKYVVRTDFRAKVKGEHAPWRMYSLEFHSKEYMLKTEKQSVNPFFLAFNSTYLYNNSCYECPYNTIPRRGNVTLCDFWGVEGDKENKMGTSLMLLNDSEGLKLWENFLSRNPESLTMFQVQVDEALKGTPRLNMRKRRKPAVWDKAFTVLRTKGFYAMYKRFVKRTILKKIMSRLHLLYNWMGGYE